MSAVFYVNNLDQSADLEKLEYLFTTVGDIKSLKLEIHEKTTRGYAVVEMETEQQAMDCIERFTGFSALGRALSLSVEKLLPRIIATTSKIRQSGN